MSNTILTPNIITKEALRILHEKLTFIGSIYRGYDDSFAKKGAKIGDTLKIRTPNEFTVRTGKTLNVQNVEEESIELKVNTQKGVDFKFDSSELTLKIDEFSERYLKPAMTRLAAAMEADALTMIKDIYQLSDQDGIAVTALTMGKAREILNNALCPYDGRNILWQSNRVPALVNSVSNNFHASKKPYMEGALGRAAGFEHYESSLVLPHTTGSCVATTTYVINGANQTGSSITIGTGQTTTLNKGDIVTLAGCYRVHPETKQNTGVLQQFVVTEDMAGGATTLKVSPAIVTSGARQNVSASPTNGGAVLKIAAPTAGLLIDSTIAYHKEAFAFATADLIMPNGLDFASRQVLDGISMRIVRDYDINNDTMPCRIDVLYGWKTIRPQLACRVHADG